MAVATSISAVGLLGAIGAAVFAAQQVRESRKSRQTQMAADFLRRWDEDELVAARRLISQYPTGEHLSTAFQSFVDSNAPEAYVLYRELDYFEQLAALEEWGAFDFALIRSLLGPRLVARWELWQPSLTWMGPDVYPKFETLARRMRAEVEAGDSAGPTATTT